MIDTELRALFDELLQDEPLATPTIDEDLARGRRLRSRRRRRISVAGVAAAAAVALAATVVPGSLMRGADVTLGPAIQPATTTDSAPYLLLGDPEWRITRAEIDDVTAAWYKRGSDRAVIAWYELADPATSALVQNREEGHTELATTVFGRDASTFIRDDGFEVIWWDGAVEFSVSALVGSLGEFQALVDELREVDAQTWLAAVEDYARDYDNTAAIAEIASNVPIPDSFAGLVEDRLDRVNPADEQALAEGVMHWVACSWVREWVGAERGQQTLEIGPQLSEVVSWAEDHDAITDETVWDYVQAIIEGEATVNDRAMADSAPDDLRCGGW